MTTVGIVGPYRLHNFGDDLIGMIMAKLLGHHGINNVWIQDIRPQNASFVNAEPRTFWSIVRDSDLTIIGGGHILGDGSFAPSSRYQRLGFLASTYRTALSKQTVFCGVGAGPLKLLSSRMYARAAIRLVRSIGVRDPESKDFLVSRLGCPPRKIHTGTDLALLCSPLLFPHSNTPQAGKRLGIQLDGIPSDQHPKLRSAINRIASQFDDVAFFSNGRRTTLAKGITGLNGGEFNYTTMPDFLKDLRSCTAFITSHLHLAIACYSLKIPTISIAVNTKTERFYRQIDHLGRFALLTTSSVADIDRVIHAAPTMQWNARDDIKRYELQDQAYNLFKDTMRPTKVLPIDDAQALMDLQTPERG